MPKLLRIIIKAFLIMYDGHKSHLSLTLAEWARKRNVVLFVLPSHTSHLSQPLDVGIFKCQYNKECKVYLQKNPGVSITKYEVAKLTARPYLKAVCPENVVSSFWKTGIYPYNTHTITLSQVAPATIYGKGDEATPDTNASDPEPQEASEDNIPPDTLPVPEETANETAPETLNPRIYRASLAKRQLQK